MLFIVLGVMALFICLLYIRICQNLDTKRAIVFTIGSLIGVATCFVMNKFILPLCEGSIMETQKFFDLMSLFFEKMMYLFIGFAGLFFITAAVLFIKQKHNGSQEV